MNVENGRGLHLVQFPAELAVAIDDEFDLYAQRLSVSGPAG
jgi:hypothetical protein